MSAGNYRRFYALLGRITHPCSREDMKESLVSSWTGGRTTSLREMSSKEYASLLEYLERRAGLREELRRKRSVCLHLMQKADLDTSSWDRVDAFCQHPKIAGKRFARLSVEELEALRRKLYAIVRKGGLQRRPLNTAGAFKVMLSGVPFYVSGEC